MINDPAHFCEFFDGWRECGNPASHLWKIQPEPMHLCAFHAEIVAEVHPSDVVPIEQPREFPLPTPRPTVTSEPLA